jgi:hypothetical protein
MKIRKRDIYVVMKYYTNQHIEIHNNNKGKIQFTLLKFQSFSI